MFMNDDSKKRQKQPFWQALLLVVAPTAVVALIEEIGSYVRHRYEIDHGSSDKKKLKKIKTN